MSERISGGELAPIATALERVGLTLPDSIPTSVLSECERCAALLEFDHAGMPIPHRCCACQDTGFVRYDLPRHDPGFGKAHHCPSCAGTQRPVESERRMRLPRKFEGVTFESWEDVGPQRMHVQRWLAALPRKPFLVLSGSKGAGKTHLMCAAGREAHAAGTYAQFWNAGDLMDRYRATFDEDRATESVADIDEQIQRVPLLLLDELGGHKNTEFAEERIFRLIDYRYREQKPLIVTTNKTPGELAALDARVYSRLMDSEASVLVPFDLPDYRQRRGR